MTGVLFGLIACLSLWALIATMVIIYLYRNNCETMRSLLQVAKGMESLILIVKDLNERLKTIEDGNGDGFHG